jgi:prophage tail gpP-like protein
MSDAPEFSTLTMTVAGQSYGGWKAARIRTSIETLAGGFSVTASERWPQDAGAKRIRTGDAVRLSIGGATVITGSIDAVRVRYDAGSHDIEFTGRDATGDLVDCSADHEPGEWRSQKLEAIAAALAAPFGIKVGVSADTGATFESFRLTDGETVAAAIERLCRHRGLLRVADGKGGLVLTRAGTGRAPAALVLGQNAVEASGEFDDSQRFSQYRVKGQHPTVDLQAPTQTVSPSAVVRDRGMGRHRPLIVIAEEPGDEAQYATRAQWEANMRYGKSRRATYTVPGWTAAGTLWRPNAMVHVRDDFVGIDEEMLIVGVDFSLDEQGSRTAISVARRQAFELLPMPERKGALSL